MTRMRSSQGQRFIGQAGRLVFGVDTITAMDADSGHAMKMSVKTRLFEIAFRVRSAVAVHKLQVSSRLWNQQKKYRVWFIW